MPTLESLETPKKYSDNKISIKLQSLISSSFLGEYPLSDDGINYNHERNFLLKDTSSSENDDDPFPLRDEREEE